MKKGVTTVQSILVIAVITLVGISAYVGFNMTNGGGQATITPGAALTETGITQQTATVSCPSDGTTDGQVRYEDTLASTFTQGNPTCYFTPKTTGLERVTVGTISTSDFSTAVDLKCTESGTKWRVICVSSQDSWTSVDEAVDFVAEGAYVKRDVKGKAADLLKFKIEDKFTGGAKFFNNTLCGTNGLGYTPMNGSQCAIVNDAAYTGTSLTLGTDGYIDAKIYIKTNNTKRQFGEDGLRTWMLVDANADQFDEPITSRDGGDKLVDALEDMDSEDRKKYTGYEYAYEVGIFGDRESVIDFYMESAAGVNPSTDPIIEFCAEGRYNSGKQKDSILVGCWSDASTQAQVTSAYRQYFKFDIA